jgi:hypothetical protein
MYNWAVPVNLYLRQFVYKEFYSAPDKFSGVYLHLRERNSLRGIWLAAYHAWYKFDELLLRNRLLFVLFVIVVIYSTAKLAASGFADPVCLLVSVLGSLHLLGILVVALVHPAVQLRYTHVSEFVVYVVFALSPLLVKNRFKNA